MRLTLANNALSRALGIEVSGPDFVTWDIEIPPQKKGPRPSNTEDSRERMLKFNPMHDPVAKERSVAKRRGRKPNNFISSVYTKVCKECGKQEEKRDTAHNRHELFCSKGCAARWYNLHGRNYK